MRFSDLDGVPLAVLEAAAAPVVLLGTLVVVVLGGLGATGVGAVADGVGAGTAVVEAATSVVAIATVLVLSAGASLAVGAYRRRFRRTGAGTQLLVGLFVPALGVVTPLAYATLELRTLAPPWWVVGVATVAANAAALRTVAMYSTSTQHRRRGAVVAAVAGVPTGVGLAILVTERFLGGAVAAAGLRLAAGVDAVGVPRSGLLLVGLPLGVAGVFAVSRARTAPSDASTPAETSLPRSPTLPEPSRVPDTSLRGAAVYLRDRGPRGLPDIDLLPGAGSSGESSPRSSGDGSDVSRPPVSAHSSGGRDGNRGSESDGRRGEGRDASAGSRGASERGGAAPADSADRSGSTAGRRSGSGDSRATGASGADSAAGSDAAGVAAPDEADDGSSSGGGAAGRGDGSTGGSGVAGADPADADADDGASTSNDSEATGNDSEATDDGTGSDTRIFTGDFGNYGESDDTVERCPACEETIPSDGVYRFCPFCGEEL